MAEMGDGSWLHGRQESAAAGGTWPIKHEVADLVREILEELPRSGADAQTLRDLVQPLRSVAAALTNAGPEKRAADSPIAGMADFVYVSPIVGFANPLAPPFSFAIDAEAQVARGRGAFGRAHEGGPGIVHGGLLAAAVDELLGMATTFSGQAGMTGRLTMKYHHPTPILEELEMNAKLDRVEGRRLFMSAEVKAGELRTASAEAVFIIVGGEKFANLDRERRAKEAS
jgi:acyl-coenzyme A thioesterase PaaI-like protein